MGREGYVFGYGGHGRVVAELAGSCGFTVSGFLFDDSECVTKTTPGELIPLRDFIREMEPCTEINVFLGVGSGRVRKRVVEELRAALAPSVRFPKLVHPSAVIYESAVVGNGVVVLPQSIVGPRVRLEEGVLINHGCSIDHDCEVGHYASLAPGVFLAGEVKVGDSAELGIRATVLPRLTIGVNSCVGAGSLVLKDVPDDSQVIGSPATVR